MNFRALLRRVTANNPALFVLALLWMPFGALGGIIVASLITSGIADPVAFREDFGTTLKTLVFVSLAAPLYLVFPTTLLGVPAHSLLLTLGLRRWPAYVTLGLAVGAISAAPLAPLMGLPRMSDPALLALYGGAGGFGAALTFWIVLRPDRQPT